MVVGIGRARIHRRRMRLQLLQQHLHRFFQLRIVAFAHQLGILPDFDVRGDAVVLHFPVAVQSADGPALDR